MQAMTFGKMSTVKGYATKNTLDVFSPQFRFLGLVAMWPAITDSQFKQSITKAILRINTVILGVCTVGLLIKAVITTDLVDRSEAMDIFTLTASALYKMVFFYHHHEEMVDMVNCGSELVSQVPPNWMKYSGFFTVAHCSLGFISITFWGLCPILKCISGETDLKHMTLPMNVYDPFDSQGILFSFIYSVCHYGLISSAHIYMAADCYLFTAIHLANGGLQALNAKLKNMEQTIIDQDETFCPTLSSFTGDESADVMHEYLKDCVKLHVHILTYIRKTDALFRSLFVADVLHAIISLSFAMLQASESKGIFETLKMVVFVSYCFVHQYLNSFFGQRLIDQQERLNKGLLLSVPWYEGSPIMRKSYHMMTTGCLKSVRLSAWSVYTLQYATFLEFVRTMISYFMVLRQVKDETG